VTGVPLEIVAPVPADIGRLLKAAGIDVGLLPLSH
jgi:hypothetical protein